MTDEPSPLPRNIAQAYATVVGELGMASAAWLFTEVVARHSGEAGGRALADRLGGDYPVADAVARAWVAGARPGPADARPVMAALDGLEEVVVIGLETYLLDALVGAAPSTLDICLLAHRPFPVDWERVVSNYGGRVALVQLDNFQRAAGPRSALLGFVYGIEGKRAYVPPLWSRVIGEDVRLQFQALIGWEALAAPMHRYPRWLTEIDVAEFTQLVRQTP